MAGAFRGICEPPSCVQSKPSRSKMHLVELMGSRVERFFFFFQREIFVTEILAFPYCIGSGSKGNTLKMYCQLTNL